MTLTIKLKWIIKLYFFFFKSNALLLEDHVLYICHSQILAVTKLEYCVFIWLELFKWWPFTIKTLQYKIINGNPSYVFRENVYSNVQNDNIKKVFCPSCDILIKGHMIFLTPLNFCYEQSVKKWRRFWIWIIICQEKIQCR